MEPPSVCAAGMVEGPALAFGGEFCLLLGNPPFAVFFAAALFCGESKVALVGAVWLGGTASVSLDERLRISGASTRNRSGS